MWDSGSFQSAEWTEDNIFTLQGICALRKLPIKTISSVKRRQFIISEAKLTPKLCSDSILTKLFIKTEKRVGYLFDLLWKNGIQGKCWKLLRSLYSNVSNKVLFGDFESDWFDQEFGLKQECVQYPHIPCRVKMLSSVHSADWKLPESHIKYHCFHITHSELFYDLSIYFAHIRGENIKSVLESLRSGKACGIDEIPNKFLKHGGNTLLNSLLDLFKAIRFTHPDNPKSRVLPYRPPGAWSAAI
jgi:hypothetical protein